MPFLCPQSCNAFPLPTREGEGVSPSDYVYLLCVCWVLSHKLPFNISTILLLGRSIHFNVVALSQFLLREKKKTKGRSSREIRVKEVLEGHFHLESVKLMSFEMKLTYLCLSVLFYGQRPKALTLNSRTDVCEFQVLLLTWTESITMSVLVLCQRRVATQIHSYSIHKTQKDNFPNYHFEIKKKKG